MEQDFFHIASTLSSLHMVKKPADITEFHRMVQYIREANDHLSRLRYNEGTLGHLLFEVLPSVVGPNTADKIVQWWRENKGPVPADSDRLDSYIAPNGFVIVPAVLMTIIDDSEGEGAPHQLWASAEKSTVKSIVQSIYNIPDGPLSRLTVTPF
jgi:hypothetical protein